MSERGCNRRAAAGRIAAMALAPAMIFGEPSAAAISASRRVEIPSGSFSLERVLVRGLGDGAEIVVTRRWRVGFAPRAGGSAVTGTQIFADVDAPAPLVALAALERSRPTDGMFPIALDAGGVIVGRGAGDGGEPFRRAMETGRLMIASTPEGSERRADANTFMATLSSMSAEAIAAIPPDLFFPRPTRNSSQRVIALPDGGTGTVEVDVEASVWPATGLLQSSERKIITRIAGGERRASERWTIAAI